MNQLPGIQKPWALTFSYGRALQGSVLQAWQGKKANIEAAQKQLLANCKRNGDAALGKYTGGSGSTQSTYVANYKYWEKR